LDGMWMGSGHGVAVAEPHVLRFCLSMNSMYKQLKVLPSGAPTVCVVHQQTVQAAAHLQLLDWLQLLSA
jgi:hypothetical protein